MEMEILWSMKCVYRFRKGVEAGVSDGGGGVMRLQTKHA